MFRQYCNVCWHKLRVEQFHKRHKKCKACLREEIERIERKNKVNNNEEPTSYSREYKDCYNKEYRKRPEVIRKRKRYMKRYNNKPEVKERKRIWNRKSKESKDIIQNMARMMEINKFMQRKKKIVNE